MILYEQAINITKQFANNVKDLLKENLDAYFRLPEKCEEEIYKLAVTIYNKF